MTIVLRTAIGLGGKLILTVSFFGRQLPPPSPLGASPTAGGSGRRGGKRTPAGLVSGFGSSCSMRFKIAQLHVNLKRNMKHLQSPLRIDGMMKRSFLAITTLLTACVTPARTAE